MSARFPCLTLEGGMLAADVIDKIAEGEAAGQKAQDFGLDSRVHLTDEISSAWSSAREHFDAFKRRLEKLPKDDTATSVTRDQWMIPFFSLLGYELTYQPRAEEVDGQTYAISHRADKNENSPPVHVVGAGQSLDKRPDSGRPRLAPHSLLQEYLNRTEHLWGIVTNGLQLRILRDSQLMRRQSYVEFDLEQMFSGEKFPDFALLYRLVHRTRFPKGMDDAQDCLLEKYFSITVEQGGRVRDHLRDGVERALKIFAEGFLIHPRNAELVKKAKEENLKPLDFYQQLLRLIYRLLFLMVGEERNLITDNNIYREHYSVSRLRRLCEQRAAYTSHEDFWLGLKTTFRLFQDESLGKLLNVPPLNGDLFNASQTPEIETLHLFNRDLLSALWHLSMYRESPSSPLRRINYGALDVEELGSVYESLLDFQPVFTERDGRFAFDLVSGTQRKSTGSYYTPPELVNELIKSALFPVMQERIKEEKDKSKKEKVILKLKVCDPACGSGHFLLSAARALGRELAKIRSGDDEPSPEHTRIAIRDVITHCVYGVDKNPLAVDLCKVALWMEGHAKGKPLTFLDHRIKCGDSLVGVLNMDVLKEGIPDEAYEPVTGDDKAIARSLKKRNREERKIGQRTLPFHRQDKSDDISEAYRLLSELPDDTPEHIRKKSEAYKKIRSHGSAWWEDITACHLWTAAFFVELTKENQDSHHIPTSDSLRHYLETHTEDARLTGYAWALAQCYKFFHWHLEFPEVFEQSGFDVVLGNPPWDVLQPEEEKFFGVYALDIAQLQGAKRKEAIQKLSETNESLFSLWQEYQRDLASQTKFMRESDRNIHLSGKVNFYSVFAEIARSLISEKGRCGIIVPTGIATDDNCKQFFGDLVEKEALVSLYDFENREAIFPAVHRSYKFSLFTVSGSGRRNYEVKFIFSSTRVNHLNDEQRKFTLKPKDFHLLNPNTHTCPVFRTKVDAELTRKIYERVPVLVNEKTGENPWDIQFKQGLFNMTSDSHLFRTHAQLEEEGFQLKGNLFFETGEESVEATNVQNPIANYLDDVSVVCLLVNEMQKLNRPTDEFYIQKHFYIANELHSIPVKSKFGKKAAGPWSWELKQKAIFAGVKKNWLREQGNAIIPGPSFPKGLAHGEIFLGKKQEVIGNIVHDLQRYSWNGLERWTTILKIVKELEQKRFPVTLETIQKEVDLWPEKRKKEIFSEESVEYTFNQMIKVGWITLGESLSKIHSLSSENSVSDKPKFLPLYEAKMMWQFDHRFATFENTETRDCTITEKNNPLFASRPRYWVAQSEVEERLTRWKHGWLIGFRDVTNATNEHTAIFSLFSCVGVGHTAPLIFTDKITDTPLVTCFIANFNSFTLDYFARQKIGGIHLTFGYVNQLPVLPPSTYTHDDIAFITPRVLELVYTAWDIKAFADDVWREADENFRALIKNQWEENKKTTSGHTWNPPEWAEIAEGGIPLPPFKWDEDRRAVLRAELDAYYARLYGLTHDELRYILDPKDVYGEDFPGETFRVLKDKETRKFGEYRTRRLVLEAWERLNKRT